MVRNFVSRLRWRVAVKHNFQPYEHFGYIYPLNIGIILQCIGSELQKCWSDCVDALNFAIELCHDKICLQRMSNKGPDKPAHPFSLISAFIVCFWDCIIISTNACATSNISTLDTFCSWGQFGSSKTVFSWCTLIEPRHEKTCLRGLRPGKTQTGLLSYRD